MQVKKFGIMGVLVFDLATKILIVDDMAAIRMLLIKSLKGIGFTDVEESVDGADAWTKLTNSKPPFQMVISDYMMPNCNGLDLLKRFRKDRTYATIPFIMLTSEGDMNEVKSAVDAGVSGYILKPINPTVLADKLQAIAERLKTS